MIRYTRTNPIWTSAALAILLFLADLTSSKGNFGSIWLASASIADLRLSYVYACCGSSNLTYCR